MDSLLFIFLLLFFCFNCLLTDQITKIILVDTLVHPSNKPVDLVCGQLFKKASIHGPYDLAISL